jgi:hypothetical protein
MYIYKLLGTYVFRHKICHPQGTRFFTMLIYISKIAALTRINKMFEILKLSLHVLSIQNVPARHDSNTNTQIVYMATKQTSCNNNHFITLDNLNVLKTLLILERAAILRT